MQWSCFKEGKFTLISFQCVQACLFYIYIYIFNMNYFEPFLDAVCLLMGSKRDLTWYQNLVQFSFLILWAFPRSSQMLSYGICVMLFYCSGSKRQSLHMYTYVMWINYTIVSDLTEVFSLNRFCINSKVQFVTEQQFPPFILRRIKFSLGLHVLGRGGLMNEHYFCIR